MPNSVSEAFARGCEEIRSTLQSISESNADIPWRPGGWTRREVLGHMIDSAANNHQRFVRASIDGSYAGPTYGQQEWVDAHGYKHQPWPVLLAWWQSYHQILVAVVDAIPEKRLSTVVLVDEDPPSTLRFRIEDYIDHQHHHLRQLAAPLPPGMA